MKTYIVTGATGFLGNNIIRELIARGENVRGFARNREKAKMFDGMTVELFFGDIRNYDELSAAFYGNDDFIVIHTAAVVSLGERKFEKIIYDVNLNGTKNVLRLCGEKKVKKLVHVSSVHAIPEKGIKGTLKEVDVFDDKNLVGRYAKTKALSSALVLEAVKGGLDAVIVHPAAIVGPHDYSDTNMTRMVLEYAAKRIPASVKGGYDFVDVRDVTEGVLLAADKGKSGRCYLLTNKFYSVRELFGAVYQSLPVRVIKSELPMGLAKFALPFLWMQAKLAGRQPLFTKYSLYTLGSNSDFSHQRATDELGYNPRPLEDTMKDMVASLKEQGRL